jgi:hypothetical protein
MQILRPETFFFVSAYADEAVLCALPASRVTPAQARHALLLLELEQLLGVESEGGGNGRISSGICKIYYISYAPRMHADGC